MWYDKLKNKTDLKHNSLKFEVEADVVERLVLSNFLIDDTASPLDEALSVLGKFSYSDKATGKFKDLTLEKYVELVDSPLVLNNCAKMAQGRQLVRTGEWTEEQFHEWKTKLKKQLPVVLVCGRSKTGRRKAEDIVDALTGLLDVDNMKTDPRAFYEKYVRGREAVLRLLGAKVSSSGGGLQFWYVLPQGMDRQQGNAWLAEQLELGDNYDHCTHDVTRCSFVSPRSYHLYVSPWLFGEGSSVFSEVSETSEPSENSSNAEPLKTQPSTNTHTTINEQGQGGSLPQSLDDVPEDLTYRGIPYKAIIAEWWRRSKWRGEPDGEPVPRERNCRLQVLVSNLRTICDYNEELMRRIVPTYGLPEKEVSSMIHGHCALAEKDKPRGLSKKIMDIVRYLSKDNEAADTADLFDDADSRLPKDLVRRLPKSLRATLSMVPDNTAWPALASALSVLGALAGDVTFRHCDGIMCPLAIFTVVVGEQSSGKGRTVGRVVEQWLKPLRQADALVQQELDQYKEDMKQWEASQRKGDKRPMPEKPQGYLRVLHPTCSSTAILQALKAAMGHTLFMYAPELETVVKAEKAGAYAQKTDILRCGFNHEVHGQSYVSDQSVTGAAPVALNFVFTGTPGAFRRYFNDGNVEGGLGSRVIPVDMPDNAFSKLPRFKELTPQQAEDIEAAARMLLSCEGEVKVPKLNKAIGEWMEQVADHAIRIGDRVMAAARFRCAEIGARAGVIIQLLMGTRRESQVAIDVALLVAERTLKAQMKYFGETWRKQREQSQVPVYKKPTPTLYDQLPYEFTSTDVAAVRGCDRLDAAVRRNICDWVGAHMAKKIGPHTWRKTGSGEAATV